MNSNTVQNNSIDYLQCIVCEGHLLTVNINVSSTILPDTINQTLLVSSVYYLYWNAKFGKLMKTNI